jgi:trigger factor
VASREEFDAKVRETIQWNYDRERGNAPSSIDGAAGEHRGHQGAHGVLKWLNANEGKLTAEKVKSTGDYERS